VNLMSKPNGNGRELKPMRTIRNRPNVCPTRWCDCFSCEHRQGEHCVWQEPKPTLPLTQTLMDIKEAEHKPDERLLTDKEIKPITYFAYKIGSGGREYDIDYIVKETAKAQRDLTASIYQQKIERIKNEIEEWINQNVSASEGIDTYTYSGLRFNTWWQEFWKQEGINDRTVERKDSQAKTR